MHPDLKKILFTEERIRRRIQELGEQISRDYRGKTPILIGVLKGSILFLSDLLRTLTIHCSVDFISLSSYNGSASTGVVRLLLDLCENVSGKDVIIVEDIVDTGLTISYLMQNLSTRKPKTLEICTLLDKTECRKIAVPLRYVGFKVPDEFVVGYGLDYNERYRHLPYIGVLKKKPRHG